MEDKKYTCLRANLSNVNTTQGIVMDKDLYIYICIQDIFWHKLDCYKQVLTLKLYSLYILYSV